MPVQRKIKPSNKRATHTVCNKSTRRCFILRIKDPTQLHPALILSPSDPLCHCESVRAGKATLTSCSPVSSVMPERVNMVKRICGLMQGGLIPEVLNSERGFVSSLQVEKCEQRKEGCYRMTTWWLWLPCKSFPLLCTRLLKSSKDIIIHSSCNL